MRRVDGSLLVVLFLCIATLAPLSAPFFFKKAHDATIGVYFLWQFDQSIRDGAIPPRWAMDWTFGYGYPLFVVIAPFSFAVAEAFHLLGLGLVDSLKAVYALAMLSSAVGMYLFARSLVGRGGAVVAALVYAYAPYHLVDLYVRADLAEFTAFAFFPFLLLTTHRLIHSPGGPQGRLIATMAILVGGLILTHIGSAIAFLPILGLYATANTLRQGHIRRLLPAGGALAVGLLIAGTYLLPGMVEQQFIARENFTGGVFDYRQQFVYAFQLFSPLWDYGYAGPGPDDRMPFQIGLVIIACAAALAAVAWRKGNGEAFFFLGILIGVAAMMLALSQPLWDAGRPVLGLLQFPWRLLGMATLAGAVTTGYLAEYLATGVGQQAMSIMVMLAVVTSYTYAVPQYTDAEFSHAHMVRFQLQTGELLGDTIWVSERPRTSPLVPQYLAGQPRQRVAPHPQVQAETLREGGSSLDLRVSAAEDADVTIYVRYFPGWRAWLDGRPVDLQPTGPQGLIGLHIPAGDHTLSLRFTDTPVRLAGGWATLMGLLLAGGIWLWGTPRHKM